MLFRSSHWHSCARGSRAIPGSRRFRQSPDPKYQLFIFFMITDPKTTVRSKLGQCIVVSCVAVVEFFLRLDQSIYAPLYALFIVGPIAMLIEMWMNSRRPQLTTRRLLPEPYAS